MSSSEDEAEEIIIEGDESSSSFYAASPTQQTKSKAKKQFLKEDEVLEEEHKDITPIQHVHDLIQRQKQTGSSSLTLDLSHFRMDEFPENALDLGDALETMYLRKNHLVSLPSNIGVFGNLKVLDVQCNRLTEIPPSITMCENLTQLNVSNNLLTSLPVELEDCSNLTHLMVDFNYLNGFPTIILSLRKLEQLYIIENGDIQSFPDVAAFQKRCTTSSDTTADSKELTIHIDNTSKLRDQWAAIDTVLSGIPNRGTNIQISWNRIWPDLVEDSIYLGSLRATQNPAVYAELHITHVLTCGRNLRTHIPANVEQLILEVDDNDEERLDRHFRRAIDFMSPAPNKNVLVHCFAGVSRSATVVIAYHMQKHKSSFRDALTFVQKRRNVINPNQNFRKQLQAWETSCQ